VKPDGVHPEVRGTGPERLHPNGFDIHECAEAYRRQPAAITTSFYSTERPIPDEDGLSSGR
jgi:hypothetical protein